MEVSSRVLPVEADSILRRLRGDVWHEGERRSRPDESGRDPQRTEAQDASGKDAVGRSEDGTGVVCIPGVHAAEGPVEEERETVLSEPLAKPPQHGAHPGTGPTSVRSPEELRTQAGYGDSRTASGALGMGGLLSDRQRLPSLCEDWTACAGSAAPAPTPPQSTGHE